MSLAEPSELLQAWFHVQQLSGYLRVLAIDPQVDVEAVLIMFNIEEITTEAVWAYLNLPTGGIKEVEALDHG